MVQVHPGLPERLTMAKHNIPLGTKVTFEGDPFIHQTADYQEIVICPPDCSWDHDHIDEPLICVSQTVTRLLPLNKLHTIFDQPGGFGRKA